MRQGALRPRESMAWLITHACLRLMRKGVIETLKGRRIVETLAAISKMSEFDLIG